MSGKRMCLSSMTILWELTLIQVKLVTADLKWQSRSENSFVEALLFTCFKCCLKKHWMPGENQEKNKSLTVQTFQYQLHCQCKTDWSSTEASWKAAWVKLNGSPYNQASQQMCRCNTQGLLFGDKISSNGAPQKNGKKKKSAPAKGGLNSAPLKSSLCRDLFALLCRHSELLAEVLVVKS